MHCLCGWPIADDFAHRHNETVYCMETKKTKVSDCQYTHLPFVENMVGPQVLMQYQIFD